MPSDVRPLTVRESMVLEMERSWWKYQGAKDTAIREQLGMTPTRFAQVLNQLIDRPEALEHDAMLVHRLRRLRDARRSVRSRAS